MNRNHPIVLAYRRTILAIRRAWYATAGRRTRQRLWSELMRIATTKGPISDQQRIRMTEIHCKLGSITTLYHFTASERVKQAKLAREMIGKFPLETD